MARTWRSPIMPASAANAGIAFFTSAECATSAWRAIAPMVTLLPSDLIPPRDWIVPRSMMSEGEARRSFIACTSDWPPASSLASPLASAAASFTLEGRWDLKACMVVSSRCFLVFQGRPHRLRRGGHARRADAQRIGDGVHERRGRADRAGFAAALHAQRIVRAGRFARVDLEIRQVGGARDAVVHERAGRELARGVVLAAFGERLADALRE